MTEAPSSASGARRGRGDRRDPVEVLAALPPAQRRALLAEWMREAGIDDDELRAAIEAIDPPA